ncbi:hypothetical protein SAY86_002531 [Trapa natans]|uniref:Uncharacterized protein n=1 Tax=Trapa natans TaxID=22666 RepID=A0AAN7LTY3_TRANT|nr:hypothetical protein SAY86_002531 [Trapa natans]
MKSRRGGANNHMDRTLFWLGSIGAHDFNRIHRSGTFSPEWIIQNAIDHFHKLIQGMVKQGGKFFVIQGLPPIGCLPLNQVFSPRNEKDRFGCALRINKAVKHHNVLLERKLHKLQKMFPNCVCLCRHVDGLHQGAIITPEIWLPGTIQDLLRQWGRALQLRPQETLWNQPCLRLCQGSRAYDLGRDPPQRRHAQGPCQAPHPWWLHASFPPHAHQVQEGPHP